MLKALLKKQLMELFSGWSKNKRKGKGRNRSKLGRLGFILLYIYVGAMLMAGMFVLCRVICAPMLEGGLDWLYFTLVGAAALTLGIFGSVFTTFSSLYDAKDNDMLLSMPIPPSRIMLVRLLGVWLMSLMFEALILAPAILVYWLNVPFGALTLLCQLVYMLMLSVFALSLSCILGWLIAKINSRLRSKTWITMLVSLAFLGAYFYFYSQAQSLLQQLIANMQQVADSLRGAYPLYLLGRAGVGSWASLGMLVGATLILFGAVWYVLSRSFIRLITTKASAAKKKYREQRASVRSIPAALLGKELKRLSSSATYMLNCALGSLGFIIGTAAALIKAQELRALLNAFEGIEGLLPLILCAVLGFAASMNDLTAPSISLEGKSLWLLQSLPVAPWQVLRAKLHMHLLVTLPCALLCGACLGLLLELAALQILLVLVFAALFVLLMAQIGLAINLKLPKFDWTNEMRPIKQSASVGITLFGGWVVVALLGLGVYLLYGKLSDELLLPLCILALAIASAALNIWLRRRGTRIFANL